MSMLKELIQKYNSCQELKPNEKGVCCILADFAHIMNLLQDLDNEKNNFVKFFSLV